MHACDNLSFGSQASTYYGPQASGGVESDDICLDCAPREACITRRPGCVICSAVDT